VPGGCGCYRRIRQNLMPAATSCGIGTAPFRVILPAEGALAVDKLKSGSLRVWNISIPQGCIRVTYYPFVIIPSSFPASLPLTPANHSSTPIVFILRSHMELSAVVHACSPSYLGIWGWEDFLSPGV
jgi:hypothetical protein